MTEIKKGEDKFYVGDNQENPLAEIHFVKTSEDTLTVDHTFVSDELRGQGVAGKLVKRIADFAREENMKVNPECTYAKKKLEGNEEYQDILSK
jgi:uncharacterized protein